MAIPSFALRLSLPRDALLRKATGLTFALSVGCSAVAGDEETDPHRNDGGSETAGPGSAGSGGERGAGAPGAGGSSGDGLTGGGNALGGSAGTSGLNAEQGGAGDAGSAGARGAHESEGCGRMRTLEDGKHTLQSGGLERSYALRVPAEYDNTHAYRLILGFHGATDSSSSVAPSYFGLWDLAQGSTIFAAPDAIDGIWKPNIDVKMVEDLLAQLEGELCIDTSRVVVEGFSHGGAMTWTLACALPGTFRAAVVHSGGGLAIPQTCEPIAFWSALGNDGSGQGMSSDFFAMTNGCSVESLPMPPKGGHVCSDYEGCSAGHATRWCDYDGPHTPAHTDSGQNDSWVPREVWAFLQQL